jgi:hypothetical protein
MNKLQRLPITGMKRKKGTKIKKLKKNPQRWTAQFFFQLDNSTLRVEWNNSFKFHSYGRSLLMEFPMPGL